MKHYSEIKIGDRESITHLITKGDIDKFVDLTGDDNKLHVNEEFAQKTNYKKTVVHGMLGASFISTVIGTKLPGDGALWFSQTLEFLLPVRIGDQINVIAEVIKKNDKENIIELKTEIHNQNRQIVTRGIAKVKVIETEALVETNRKENSNKVALVIGGTGGIGQSVCIQLAKDGFDIILHYHRNKAKAIEIKSIVEKLNRKIIVVNANTLDAGSIGEIVSSGMRAFEKIDVLVNCAATVIPTIKFQDLLWSDFLTQLELNIKLTFLVIQGVIPGMISRGYGKIINVGSQTVDKPTPDWAHYITAKSGLVGLTKSLALELGPKGIRINMVSPSLLNTDLTSDVPEKIKLLTAAQTPLRRLALPSDVAGVIGFLASEKSDFLTGENIRVTGGQVMI
jgi:3-oxoacyl-[acyl-carrier protein] reductase